MKINKHLLAIFAVLTLSALAAACSPASKNSAAGMANPAAVYCVGLGYTLESVERDGGEDADCVFADGESCPQWDFLTGRCGQAYSFCEQQGSVLEEGDGNVGLCRFADGSTCDEYSLYSGECAQGDNLDETSGYPIEDEAAVGYPVEDEAGNEYPIEDATEEAVDIRSFEEARDYMAAYFANEYDLEITEPWTEEDITQENTTASTTMRYVSGAITIEISSMASAPAVNYTVDASNIVNGFNWQGSLSSDGTITADEVFPPATVLSVEDARDAALAYLSETYEMTLDYNWADSGGAEKPKDDQATIIWTFGADSWTVEVEFKASAPLVGQYLVRVFDESGDFSWEGEITLYGEITEISSAR